MPASEGLLLKIRGLNISFSNIDKPHLAVNQFSLDFPQKHIVALVGESGSGKTLVSRFLLGLLPEPADFAVNTIEFDGKALQQDDLHTLRGRSIGLIFQEPLTSLNPSLTVGTQMIEALQEHHGLSKSAAKVAAIEALNDVGIKKPLDCYQSYVHQLSGGMRQRVMIATVFLLEPKLLIADEPTTALDPILRKEILLLLKAKAQKQNSGLLIITHDIASVIDIADDLVVMQRGRVVESGNFSKILAAPQAEYTKMLLEAAPSKRQFVDNLIPDIDTHKPIIEMTNIYATHTQKSKLQHWLGAKTDYTLKAINLTVYPNQVLGVIGESGSGKTTVARIMAGLHRPSSGTITINGTHSWPVPARDNIQFIHQDAADALDPRMRIAEIVAEGLVNIPTEHKLSKVIDALSLSGLDAECLSRLPHQLSGGQRQRVCIARAIITNPQLIIADEPISALDLTLQLQIIDLLKELKSKLKFACVFVSHDMSVIAELADHVCVLQNGEIVESGDNASVFTRPQHPYTKALLNASSRIAKVSKTGYKKEPWL